MPDHCVFSSGPNGVEYFAPWLAKELRDAKLAPRADTVVIDKGAKKEKR